MFSDKLVTLLLTFSKVELNRLRKLVASPYFNDEADALRLYDICHQQIRKSQETFVKMSKEQIWKKLQPGRPIDDAHLRRMTSDLTRLAMKFRALEQRSREPLEDWLVEQKALESAGLDKHLAGVERQITHYFDDAEVRNTDFYLHSFRYHWNIFNRSYRVVAATDYMAKLLPADMALERFYVTQKLKMYVAWLSYRQFRSTEQELPLPPQV